MFKDIKFRNFIIVKGNSVLFFVEIGIDLFRKLTTSENHLYVGNC